MDAAASEVNSLTSKGGETSTTSAPTMFSPARPRTSRSAVFVSKPPTTGVPVPGAQDGSRKSMSKLT